MITCKKDVFWMDQPSRLFKSFKIIPIDVELTTPERYNALTRLVLLCGGVYALWKKEWIPLLTSFFLVIVIGFYYKLEVEKEPEVLEESAVSKEVSELKEPQNVYYDTNDKQVKSYFLKKSQHNLKINTTREAMEERPRIPYLRYVTPGYSADRMRNLDHIPTPECDTVTERNILSCPRSPSPCGHPEMSETAYCEHLENTDNSPSRVILEAGMNAPGMGAPFKPKIRSSFYDATQMSCNYHSGPDQRSICQAKIPHKEVINSRKDYAQERRFYYDAFEGDDEDDDEYLIAKQFGLPNLDAYKKKAYEIKETKKRHTPFYRSDKILYSTSFGGVSPYSFPHEDEYHMYNPMPFKPGHKKVSKRSRSYWIQHDLRRMYMNPSDSPLNANTHPIPDPTLIARNDYATETFGRHQIGSDSSAYRWCR